MNIAEHMKGIYGGLRAQAETAIARLLRRPGPEAANVRPSHIAPPDPTKVLFPDQPVVDSETAGGLPLSALLENSARSMVRRTDELREQARALTARMGERAEAEITLSAQALRVVIGLVWLGIAVWLYYNGMRGEAGALPEGMPVDDAFVLSRTFFIVAATGLGVAFGVAALVNLFGHGDNRRVREEAEQLGLVIADTSREFDRALTGFRAAMDRRNDPADAVIDLSRAHLTALEACAYFREIGFLTNAEGDEALRLFKGFLSRKPKNPPPLPVFLSGVLFGAFFLYIGFFPKPEIETVTPAIAQYPWALNSLLFGGLFYAGAGLLLSLLGGPIAAGAAAKARVDALNALRGGFTAREAPRPADVVRRIEDAVDVFRARVSRRRDREERRDHAGANQTAGFAADDSATGGDIPSWRKRDSSVHFVETDFAAAPREWRTDAYAKKFAAEDDGRPGSKRGLLGLKKPSRD